MKAKNSTSRYHRTTELTDVIIAFTVVCYAAVVLVGTRSYSSDARLYPTVVGILTAVAAVVYLVSSVRTLLGRPDQQITSGMSGEDSPDIPEHSAMPLFGGALVGIGVLYVLGIYPFVISMGLLYGRFLARMTWRMSLYVAAGLLAFVFVLLDVVLGIDPLDTGLVAQWAG